MSVPGSINLKRGDGTAGRPRRHRLVSEQRTARVATGAGDSDPGADFAATRSRLRFDSFIGIAEKILDAAIKKSIEKSPVEVDIPSACCEHSFPLPELSLS